MAEDYEEVQADARAIVTRLGKDRVYPRAGEALEDTAGVELAKAAGEYDWLRLYFEEVIWPEAEKVRAHVRHLHRSGTVQVCWVSGDEPPCEVEAATRQIIKRALL